MTGDDRRLFDLVTRRFLGNFYPPAVWERVERLTVAGGHHFQSRARSLKEPGWRSVLPPGSDSESEAVVLTPLVAGQDEIDGVPVGVEEVEVAPGETKPPPRISEARLLSLMENAGRQIDDEDLAAVLHEKGIGTPATRAEVIENLIRKGYCVRQGKTLRPSVKGIRLIDSLRRINIDRLASPQLTGELEQHLQEVERGTRTAEQFVKEVTAYAVEVVERAKTFGYEELYADAEELGPCPSCQRPVVEMAWFYRCTPVNEDRDADCPMRFWKDTSGRYLDPGAVRALLADGQTGVIDGFTARSGRTYRGYIEVDTEEWKLKVRSAGWNEESASDVPEYDVDPEPLGACALCGEPVIETSTEYSCRGRLEGQKALEEVRARALAAGKKRFRRGKDDPNPCGVVLPRTVCKREITRDESLYYLKNGRTELLEDFTSRLGRPFSATLVFNPETGRHGFEFQPRASGASKKAPKKKSSASAREPGEEVPEPSEGLVEEAESVREDGQEDVFQEDVLQEDVIEEVRAEAKNGPPRRSPPRAEIRDSRRPGGTRFCSPHATGDKRPGARHLLEGGVFPLGRFRLDVYRRVPETLPRAGRWRAISRLHIGGRRGITAERQTIVVWAQGCRFAGNLCASQITRCACAEFASLCERDSRSGSRGL